ncbi:MAG: FAD-dependent oxidoreductase [bacterium]
MKPMRRRDRTPISIWMRTTPETAFPLLTGEHEVDVAIVGAGITGVTAAWLAQQQGHRVALIDAEEVCSGVTAYTTAKLSALQDAPYGRIASDHGEDAARLYADANREAIREIARITTALGIDCELATYPACVYTTDEAEADRLRREAEAAKRAGLPARFTTEIGLPWPVAGAVWVDDEAAFHPRKYCLGVAEAFAAAGGRVYEHSRVTDATQDGDRVTLHTEDGRLHAAHVLLATQIPFLDRGGFFAKTSPQRSYGLVVRLERPVAPAALYITRDGATRSLRPLPGHDGLIVGGENHKTGQDDDTRARYAALEEFARRHFPVEAVVAHWSAHDYQPVDGLPYIGRLPRGSERIQVATGFNKWGLTLGPVAAMSFVDSLADRQPPWAELFDATRVNVMASARQFIAENANVGARFFGDRIRHAVEVDGPDLLMPGQGGVVRVAGQAVGGYRDEAGALHLVSLVCTHLGCHLTWNTGDRTWDCPCHGSRYGFDGVVIQGPAVRDLDRPDPPADEPAKTD